MSLSQIFLRAWSVLKPTFNKRLFSKPPCKYQQILTSTSPTWADDRVKTISQWVNSVFPIGTQTVLRRRNDDLAVSNASPDSTKRQREFAAGRACAATLLNRWNVAEEVGVAEDRSPIWPDGYAGSISHSNNWVWSAIAKSARTSSLGIDTEIVVSPDTREMLNKNIVTEQERLILEPLGLSPETSFTLAFSAKEAFYKCWYPITREFFGFKQVAIESCTADTIRISSLDSNPNFHLTPSWLDVHFVATDRDVFNATWMEQRA